ncbi:MAG TPA: hypothetical protein VHZ24_13885 [Pirellulales bacterium]|jgi:hypothetical protein|nr:hypothetical protein [Pirellulales bacterium]
MKNGAATDNGSLAQAHPNQGMIRLSGPAANEMQKAVKRHAESLRRAIQVLPAVREFFEKDAAAIMNAK